MKRSSAQRSRRVTPEGALALLTVGDIDDLKEATHGLATILPRIEKVMRGQLEATHEGNRNIAAIAENTKCLPQLAKDIADLLDVLVGKRTNGHTDLQASTTDAERTEP